VTDDWSGFDLSAFDDVGAYAAVAPADGWTWSEWQRLLLADASPWRVIRAANQIGKTSVICADIVHEIRGTNPFRSRRFSGPINIILVSESIEQLSAPGGILEKLWELLPKAEIDSRLSFVPGEGIRGVKIPVIRFTAGPGAGSTISVRTYRQDPATLAGVTVHHVYCDEPMPERTYGELQPRLLRHDGTMTISFTPAPDMPDQGWLRKLVEAGEFSEHHAEMTPDNAWPAGYTRPFLSAEKIAEAIRRMPAAMVALRVKAAWETVSADRWLTAYSDAAVKRIALSDLPKDVRIIVGIDHGLVVGKQKAVIIAVADGDTDAPKYWILGECGDAEVSTPAHDAAAILAMLSEWGLSYEHVDEWIGDRSTGDGRQLKAKSNAELRVQLMHQAGVTSRDPRAKLISTPIKGAGSVWYGLGLINAALSDGRMVIDPRCRQIVEACQKFKGDSRDPVKDVLDAARYAIERGTRRRQTLNVRGTYGAGPRVASRRHTR
jgi:hypothetical protein